MRARSRSTGISGRPPAPAICCHASRWTLARRRGPRAGRPAAGPGAAASGPAGAAASARTSPARRRSRRARPWRRSRRRGRRGGCRRPRAGTPRGCRGTRPTESSTSPQSAPRSACGRLASANTSCMVCSSACRPPWLSRLVMSRARDRLLGGARCARRTTGRSPRCVDQAPSAAASVSCSRRASWTRCRSSAGELVAAHAAPARSAGAVGCPARRWPPAPGRPRRPTARAPRAGPAACSTSVARRSTQRLLELGRVGLLRPGVPRSRAAPNSLRHPPPVARAVVGVEDQVAQADAVEPGEHGVDGRPLLGDEQHPLALAREAGDEVGDGLRLAGAGRALDDEVRAGADRVDRGLLGRVRVEDEQLVRPGRRRRASPAPTSARRASAPGSPASAATTSWSASESPWAARSATIGSLA